MSAALSLYKRHTAAELVAMRQAICDDPKNKNTQPGSIYLYLPAARKKLAAIGWAITYHLSDKKEAPVAKATGQQGGAA